MRRGFSRRWASTCGTSRSDQDATFRLRVGDYRVFYDVEDDKVTVTAVLHKADTAHYYRREDT